MATQFVDIVNGSDTLATVSITAATRANPCVITSAGHGFGNGQWIHIASVAGMTQLNGNTYKTANVAANTFELQDLDGNNINSSAFTAYTSGGTVTQWRKIPISGITQANPAVVTAKKHGFSNGNIIIIEDVAGMTQVNDVAFTVANATTDTFELSGIDSSGYGAWTSGGTATRPFFTMNTLESWRASVSSPRNRFYMNGDTVKFAKTFSYGASITVGSGNITFTRNSITVTTSVDLRASISVGDYIGLTSATCNGWDKTGSPTRPDIFYKVTATAAGSITLNVKYGSTTTTVSSVYRLRVGTEIRATGSASATAITTAGQGITYEGGYSFNGAGAITRDGTTAFKPVTAGDYHCWTSTDISSIWRYFGFLSGGRGWTSGAACNSVTIEYCSADTSLYFGFYNASTVGGVMFKNCWGTTANGSSSECFQIQSGPNSMTKDSYGISATVGIRPFVSGVGGSIQIQGCRSECSTNGFNVTSTANPIIDDCISVDCSAQGFAASSSGKFTSCTVDACTTGFSLSTTANSMSMKDCIMSNCTTTAIQAGSTFGTTLEGCSFISNVIDITTDQYTSGLVLIDCDSTTPTNWHISRVLNNSPIICKECTIDAPSITKAFQIVTGSNYDSPQFLIQNSYGVASGSYYANGQYVEDSTIFRTSGSSMKLQYNSTVSGTTKPVKMVSYYVAGGTAKTITYYLKRDASAWSGTITPQLRLNGKLIKTESNITSLTTSWVQYTASATSGQISTDGELSLEFIYNANNVAIWIDDVTIA